MCLLYKFIYKRDTFKKVSKSVKEVYGMTAFKVLLDFACSHLKLSQKDFADLISVNVESFKNWTRRGFPEKNSVKEICEGLFWDPDYRILSIYESTEKIIADFVCYIQRYGYFIDVDSKKKFTWSEFCLFINDFLLIDSSKKKKIPNTENSSYESIFTILDCVLDLSLPDYSTQRSTNTKSVPLTRATLISLVKHCANIDIDNELSVDYSIELLNQIIKKSSHTFLQEFANRGYSFSGTDELVFVVNNEDSKTVNFAENHDVLFEVLKTLYKAYQFYDIHGEVSSRKKIELNTTISVFINAISLLGVFSTSERKEYLCTVIENLINTHNHDANFLYPILYNTKEKTPPVVEVGTDKMVELIGAYCKDVYDTDNNAIIFINNFIETLNHYHTTIAEKTAIFDGLIYQKKLYNLRIWQELANIDKRKLMELQLHVETEIFSLVNQEISYYTNRKIISFTCMFARGLFDNIIYSKDPAYFRKSSAFLKFVLRRFKNIVEFRPIRKLDVAQGLSKALLTISKYDSSAAYSIIQDIDISLPCFDDCILLKDTYNFLIKGTFSSDVSAEYRKLFSNSHDFFDYVKNNIISVSHNPFLTGDNPLVFIAFINIRKAYKTTDEEVTTELINFADNVLFWLLESLDQNKRSSNASKYLRWLCDINYCLDVNRTQLFKNKKRSSSKILYQKNNLIK